MIKPWYKVATPREDLRDNRPLDAAEFAVHLDHVREGDAPLDYQDPRRFFERTYLTKNLTDLASQVVRRLSGITTETSAVFNLSTQFGGGKTHALTLLYHLARAGDAAASWPGVARILDQAGVRSIPKAATAIFVGLNFDSLTGRGGDDGTPLRKTPWGEIAFQLGGEEALAVLAQHEEKFIEPKGDVIQAFLPKDKPCLILMDEVINYVSTYRKLGYHNALYNFMQSLSETARTMENVVLVVSIPASELEYAAEDEADEQRFKKMLDRLGKAILMSTENETSEIIRRRLFEWDPHAVTQDGRILLSQEAKESCAEYADWVLEHRSQLPNWFPVDNGREVFEAAYPFHPSVLSVFERKWQVLPRFQRTRGVLRLLALWVARAYQDGFKGAQRDALIGLGSAPLDDPMFRAAVFEQLGENRLEGAITTDICGKKESFAVRLDDEAVDTIRKARLHRKAASTIFFESNGGQERAEATVPEIRLDLAEPDLDIGNVETVLEALRNTGYFLTVEGNKYRFNITANLNKLLADRRANVKEQSIQERVKSEIQKVFGVGNGIEKIFFPEQSNQIPDRAVLALIVLSPEHSLKDENTLFLIDKLTREAGNSGRTFKSALLWAVAEDPAGLYDDARRLLAWEEINSEYRRGELKIDDTQHRTLETNLGEARRDLRESIWRTYKNVCLLGKDNAVRTINLGLVHSSAAESLTVLILSRLRQDGDLEDGISPNFLLRHWPPAFKEWSTRGVRDAFFASPLFPRLSRPDAIKETIAKGVSDKLLAYVGKGVDNRYQPFEYGDQMNLLDVEISDEMFITSSETAESYLKSIQPVIEPPIPQPPEFIHPTPEPPGQPKLIIEPPGKSPIPPKMPEKGVTRLTWSGLVPYQKYSSLYLKVLSKFATGQGMQISVTIDVNESNGISSQRIEEVKANLRELGLTDEIKTS
jgi:hypothetical protein